MKVEVIALDHIYIAVRNLSASEAFYDPVMRFLDFRKGTVPVAGAPHLHYYNRVLQYTIRPARSDVSHDPYAAGLHHICFRVQSRAEVDATVRGLRDLGVSATEPRTFPEYDPDYYATFFEDPDGIRLEIVAEVERRRLIRDHWSQLTEFENPLAKAGLGIGRQTKTLGFAADRRSAGRRERRWPMGLLTADMKRVVAEQRLGFVATVCPDGTPNLSPKGTTAVWDDDHLVFANIRSPGTLANLRQNANVEVNVVDPFVRKGYRFKGVASVLESGALYDKLIAFYKERGSRVSAIREVVMVRVQGAQAIDSPAYDVGLTEDEVRGRWERYFQSLRVGKTTSPTGE